jgi:hypothetical protein
MTIYRDTEGDQLWRIIPFDMNVSWGQLYCGDSLANFNAIIATNDNYKSHPLYGGQTVLPTTGGANWNRIYDSIVRIPGTREMLLRRMRTLLDTFVQSPDTHPLALTMEKRFLSFSNSIYAESILDRLRWGWEANPGSANGPYCYGTNVWMTNHLTDIIKQYVIPRRKHWYVTHSITNTARAIGIANASNAGIPLTQPTNALISVAGVEFNPSSPISRRNSLTHERESLCGGHLELETGRRRGVYLQRRHGHALQQRSVCLPTPAPFGVARPTAGGMGLCGRSLPGSFRLAVSR